ncbi:hypothetical protein ATKI12_0067 [Kitasatospora sp. Ki12]
MAGRAGVAGQAWLYGCGWSALVGPGRPWSVRLAPGPATIE